MSKQAYEIVGPEIDSMTNYADSAYKKSIVFIDELLNFIENTEIPEANVSLSNVGVDVPEVTIPTAPAAPTVSINLPSLPADFVPNTIQGINLNAIGAIPTFTDTSPTINLPNTPAPFSGTLNATPPVLKEDFNFPEAPESVLPSVPTFESLNIPASPTINIPSFSQTLPSATAVVVPVNSFHWGGESPFSDTCLTSVKNKLCDWLQNGGTGLIPVVEQAIFDRGRNREDINSTRSESQILVEQAARGFSRPQGSAFAAVDLLAQETQNKAADLSREIMLKQADLEQQNMHFAIQQTIALETALIAEHQQIQARSFEAAKYAQESAIQLYNAQLAKVNLELEAFKSYSSAYEAQVSAALSEIEIFKGEIEAQALVSEINQNTVKLYLAQIEGVKTSVSVYKTEVDAIASQISAEGLKVDNFKGMVDAYSAEVEANKAEFEAYGVAVKGELGKVDIFDSQVKAFIGRIDAYGKSVEAQSSITDSEIDVEKLRLSSYLAKLDAIIKQVDVESKVYGAQVDVYRGQAAMYSAEAGVNVAASELGLKEVDARVRVAAAQADIAIKNAEINIKNAESSDKLRLEAVKAGADISKGLAQASLSAINIGATVSSSGSSSDSSSKSYTETHNYQEK